MNNNKTAADTAISGINAEVAKKADKSALEALQTLVNNKVDKSALEALQTTVNESISELQENIKNNTYEEGDGISIDDRKISVDKVKLNKTQLNDDIRVAGGPLSIISNNWPEEWYLNGEPIIPKDKSMYEILTALFLKVVNGDVSWGEVSWSPKLSKPTIKLTGSSTVEVGTKIEINTITPGVVSDLNRSAKCICTEGYFDTVDGEWNSNKEKIITKSK